MEKERNREECLSILKEYTKSESLLKHAYAVETCVVAYAKKIGEDENYWGNVALLHDFDYERWPDIPDHTRKGAEVLRERGVSEEIIGAVLSHTDWNQEEYPRDTALRRTLFAVDELCGFLTACALVRPTRLDGLKPKSVRKKMKTRSFAATVSRDDIAEGHALIGVDLNEHISHCVAALGSVAAQLGLVHGKEQKE